MSANELFTNLMLQYFQIKTKFDSYINIIQTKYSAIDIEKYLLPHFGTRVASFNAKGDRLSKLYRFKISLFSSEEGDLGFRIVCLLIVLGANVFGFSIMQKVWILSLLYLLITVSLSIKLPLTASSLIHYKGRIYHDEEIVKKEIHQKHGIGNMSKITVNQCDFSIPVAKRIQSEVVGDEILQLPQYESKLILKISVNALTNRWDVWRKYEEFYELYLNLVAKYPYESIPVLSPYKKLYNNYRSSNSNNTLSTSMKMNIIDYDHKVFNCFDEEFLQVIQMEALNWLLSLKNNVLAYDDEDIRAFLLLPVSFQSEEPTPSGKLSGVHPSLLTIKTKYNLIVEDTHPYYTLDRRLPSSTSPASPISSPKRGSITKTVSGETTPPLPAVASMEDFQFSDIPKQIAQMCEDSKFSHSYQVRGLNYLNDKKKVSGGFAIAKFMGMELYKVKNPTKERDRYDHIALYPKVQRKIQALNALQEKPFVVLLNMQIPGDPPIMVCFYFVIPSYFHKNLDTDIVMQKAKKMFEKFIDIPIETAHYNPNQSSSFQDSQSNSGSGKLSQENNNSAKSSAPSSQRGPVMEENIPTPFMSDVKWPPINANGVFSRRSFQNMRFKLIPQMVEAPWVVQAAVGATPCVLGQKIVIRYFRGENYLEIGFHIGSSPLATRIVSMCRSYSKHITCTLGVVIQGENEEELPEVVLAACTIKRIDFTAALDFED